MAKKMTAQEFGTLEELAEKNERVKLHTDLRIALYDEPAVRPQERMLWLIKADRTLREVL